ncbi:hypothetical protein [Cryptosporangium sp. NPDC048952]|uniref:hypothetical protein n=1 Tax=Cryptosporangium sp. NPDC048952 TaxID=3363961 RepID=UPI003717F30D
MGIARGRAPMAVLLYLAAVEQRLVTAGDGGFLVLSRPAAWPEPTGGSRSVRVLRWLDRNWDSGLWLFVLTVVSWLAAVALVLVGGGRAVYYSALCLALLPVVVFALLGTVAVGRGVVEIYRTLVRAEQSDLTRHGTGQLLTWHWSVRFCHLQNADSADRLFRAARARSLRTATPEDRQPAPPVLFVDERGFTSSASREWLGAVPGATPLAVGSPYVVLGGRHPRVRLPDAVAVPPGRAIPWLLLGILMAIVASASVVADVERQCSSCGDGRPTDYLSAIYWLINRLFGGDPENLAPGTILARTTGIAITVMGYVLLGAVISSLVQRSMGRLTGAGAELVEQFNAAARTRRRGTRTPRSGSRYHPGARRRL